ncbi:KCNA1 [Branchiostoma lanceolatum]|uniref:KCNA1 protein n=1 Tax=Branchiostoma lanceolatum TaxID=7740 RepID=A0A8J9YTV7_BRALA|nr:KCNA1 [Branchiostoma lanceolatum]
MAMHIPMDVMAGVPMYRNRKRFSQTPFSSRQQSMSRQESWEEDIPMPESREGLDAASLEEVARKLLTLEEVSSNQEGGEAEGNTIPLTHHQGRPCGQKGHGDTCARIVINVSGLKFETQRCTLCRYPDTLLGNADRMKKYYDSTRQEYFFDRHRPSFEAILSYFQTGGRLNRPADVPVDIFLEELKFYDMGASLIRQIRDKEGLGGTVMRPRLPRNRTFRKIWLLFEYPESSKWAKIVAGISVAAVFLAVGIFSLETVPVLQDFAMDLVASEPEEVRSFAQPFFALETICVAWFIFELIIRFVVCPSKLEFIKGALNIIDLLSIVPYFVDVTVMLTEHPGAPDNTLVHTLRVIRLARVFRILKVARHSRGMQVLGKTFKASWKELGLLLFFLLVGIVLFSSAIYFVEYDLENSHFQSIPSAFWWAVITMVTVGYGDMYPQSLGGKLVGGLCALSGVLTVSLVMPVFVTNFNRYYYQDKNAQSFRRATGSRMVGHWLFQVTQPSIGMVRPNVDVSFALELAAKSPKLRRKGGIKRRNPGKDTSTTSV